MVMGVVEYLPLIDLGALFAFVYWQAMQFAEHLEQFIVHVAGVQRIAQTRLAT
ncbi:hypothetical protein D3C71_2104980 [compost metagenome]